MLTLMSAEFEKLASQLKCGGHDVAAEMTREFAQGLKAKGLIPPVINGTDNPVIEGDFGYQIREYRKRKNFGLSQRALAVRADMNHSTISRIETDHHMPSFGSITRLAAALKLNQDQILGLLRSISESRSNRTG